MNRLNPVRYGSVFLVSFVIIWSSLVLWFLRGLALVMFEKILLYAG